MDLGESGEFPGVRGPAAFERFEGGEFPWGEGGPQFVVVSGAEGGGEVGGAGRAEVAAREDDPLARGEVGDFQRVLGVAAARGGLVEGLLQFGAQQLPRQARRQGLEIDRARPAGQRLGQRRVALREAVDLQAVQPPVALARGGVAAGAEVGVLGGGQPAVGGASWAAVVAGEGRPSARPR